MASRSRAYGPIIKFLGHLLESTATTQYNVACAASRNTVSGVMPRRPRTMSLILAGGTCKVFDKACWLKPRGFKKSSHRISPG